VRILGVGGGLEYANNGATHLAVEDVGVLRTQPDVAIVCPTDAEHARSAILATSGWDGPVYYRLSKFSRPRPALAPADWTGHGVDVWHEGDGSVALVALGASAHELEPTTAALREQGIEPSCAAVSVIAPAPVAELREFVARHRMIVTIEAHQVVGGLGSLVCEIVAEAGLGTRVVRCGIETVRLGSGSAEYLARAAGIDSGSIAARVSMALSESGRGT
jgi:transketolase